MLIILINLPHLWLSCSVLKAGRREVSGSIPGRACRHSRSELSVVFFETRLNTGDLRKPPKEGTTPTEPGLPSGQLALSLQPTNQPCKSYDA